MQRFSRFVTLITGFALLLPCAASATEERSADGAWIMLGAMPAEQLHAEGWIRPDAFIPLRLDREVMAAVLKEAPMEGTPEALARPLQFALPSADGGFAWFAVVESPIMEPGLAARLPEVKTYRGQGIDDPAATVRFDLTPQGFHSQVFSPRGAEYIDPYTRGNAEFHSCYFIKGNLRPQEWKCFTRDDDGPIAEPAPGYSDRATGSTLRTYRIAVAAAASYTTFHGGTQASGQSAIVTAMNRVNQVFENEFAVRMVLVANNINLVYTNAATAPYTDGDLSAMLNENQTNLNAVIGSANYDVGHVFSGLNLGGLAQRPSVCLSGKARGGTGLSSPYGDYFTVKYVCHELGHQFGARHSFNADDSAGNNVCLPNRSASAAYEVGAGTTIMSYAGLCGGNNDVGASTAMFNQGAYAEIAAQISGGSSCSSNSATGNTPPTVNGGPDRTIPANTPFELTATSTDVNGDTVTYSWEERMTGSWPAQPASGPGSADNGASPIFKVFPPNTSGTRTFPRLSDVVSGFLTVGEQYPVVGRTMRFRVTARDNRSGGGGVNTDDVNVTIHASSGPFRVTSPNTNVLWSGTRTVTWDVAGTSSAPVNCTNVRILLSTDGGFTYPIVLLDSTPNTGSADVVLPQTPTTTARVRVEAVGNLFFDVSNTNFQIVCTAPSGLTASDGIFCDRIQLSWTASPGATSYEIYRSNTSSILAASLLAGVPSNSYADTAAVPGSTHYYWVRTLMPGCTSGYGESDSGFRGSAPSGPTNVSATDGTSCSAVNVSFSPSPNATSYSLYRGMTSDAASASLVTSGPASPLVDTTGSPGTTYFYWVSAENGCGSSVRTGGDQGHRGAPPVAPGGVSATDESLCNRVDVSWTPVSGATNYEVSRHTINNVSGATPLGSIGSPPFADATGIAGQSYFYFVRAIGACGSSGWSASDAGTRGIAPTIGTHPATASACIGANASFSVSASGSGVLSYQWRKNGSPVGSNAPNLHLPAVTNADDGAAITVDVTNHCGSTTSQAAMLHVRSCGPRIHVDVSVPVSGNGSAWATAFKELREALAHASTEPGVTEVWISSGMYLADAGLNRAATFQINTPLSLLGGFPHGGGDGTIASRDLVANRTILSGDLAGDDGPNFSNIAENTRHVVSIGAVSATLDGIEITSGNADGAEQDGNGGGVLVAPGGSITLRNCTVRLNSAANDGGGISAPEAHVLESTLSENRASRGGGLFVSTGSTITSTISGNTATLSGGGIACHDGSIGIRESTIASNNAGAGGGLAVLSGSATVHGAIIAMNIGAPADIDGTVTSLGHNLIGDASGGFGFVASDILNTSASLGALSDNGGPTRTHMPDPGSPAIDAGDSNICPDSYDQRGIARPIDGTGIGTARCDIGAVEAPAPAPGCIADMDDGTATGTPDGGVTIEDLLYFLVIFDLGDPRADLDDGSFTGTRDEGVTIEDLLFFLYRFDLGC